MYYLDQTAHIRLIIPAFEELFDESLLRCMNVCITD